MGIIIKFYKSFAVLGISTIIVVLAGLFCLSGALELRHMISGKGQNVYSNSFDMSSYKLTLPKVATEIALEFDRWGSSQPYMFNPWTTSMTMPYKSNHINVVRDDVLNFRRNGSNNYQDLKKTGKPIIIWAFGGSTMFGFGVSDQNSIPARIERNLKKRFVNRPVKVFNFGQPYWHSSVEIAAYISLLRRKQPPGVVIFLDGVNDVSWGLAGSYTHVFSRQAGNLWERARQDSKHMLPWISFNQSFPINRIKKWLNYTYDLSGGSSGKGEVNQTRRGYSDVTKIMLHNFKIIEGLSKMNGLKSFVFIQPTPWYGDYVAKVDKTFPFGNVQEARKVYKKLINASQSEYSGFLFDLSSVLHKFDRPYVDNVHYSDSANDFLAAKICSVISPVITQIGTYPD